MSERPKMLTPDIFFCAVLSSVGKKKKTPNPKQKLAKKTNKQTHSKPYSQSLSHAHN